MQVAHAQAHADLELGDVRVDPFGNVGGQALDLDLPQVVLDDPAGLDAHRLADDPDGDVQADLLVAPDGQQVQVDEPAVDVVALDVPGDDQVLGPVHREVDQDVVAGARVEDVEQVLGVHRHRGRVEPRAVQHRGHATGGPQLPGDALAGALPGLGDELDFGHGRRPSGVRGSAGNGTNTLRRCGTAMRPGARASG